MRLRHEDGGAEAAGARVVDPARQFMTLKSGKHLLVLVLVLVLVCITVAFNKIDTSFFGNDKFDIIK